MSSKQLTFGQEAVLLTFNPSTIEAANIVKQKFADLIDEIEDFKNNPNTSRDAGIYASKAIIQIQIACMQTVRALTCDSKKTRLKARREMYASSKSINF